MSKNFENSCLQKPKNEPIYEIDFDGNCRAIIKIDGDKIRVISAMNGWGDSIPISKIEII